MKLEQKVIWITGASSGIGEALTQELSKKENRLVISARRIEELERVKKACEGNPAEILVLPMDMAEHSLMEQKTQQVMDTFGHIDCIIMNAGISNRSYIVDTKYDVFTHLMNVNFLGNVALTKALLPQMIERKQGHFVAISSISGKVASPGRGAYCATKHALNGFMDTLRMEQYANNLKVTIVCPGFVRTNVTKNSLTASGTPQGKLDKTTAGGVTAAYAAQRIVKATESDKQEVAFGGKEKLALYVKRFAPSALTKLILMNEDAWKLNNTVS